MKTTAIFYGIALGAVFLCTGCQADKAEETLTATVSEQKTEEKEETSEIQTIAEQYCGLYEKQQETDSIIAGLGKLGYSAVDERNEINMVNASAVEKFCEQVDSGEHAQCKILRIRPNGGFYCYEFQTDAGAVQVLASTVVLDNGKPQVKDEARYQAYTWQYTKNGYLIFEEYHPEGFDGSSGHTAIRVKPLAEKCREYNRSCIAPIGYGYNNLFITSWTEEDFGNLNFYDLYDSLYLLKYGTPFYGASLTAGQITEIPRTEFENVILSCIQIDSSSLQERTAFDAEKDVYIYRARGLEDCCPPDYPQPEVVDVAENEDGTVTLTVHAVWEWKNEDEAFAHAVTIRPTSENGVQYVSNQILPSEHTLDPIWYETRLKEKEWQEWEKQGDGTNEKMD